MHGRGRAHHALSWAEFKLGRSCAQAGLPWQIIYQMRRLIREHNMTIKFDLIYLYARLLQGTVVVCSHVMPCAHVCSLHAQAYVSRNAPQMKWASTERQRLLSRTVSICSQVHHVWGHHFYMLQVLAVQLRASWLIYYSTSKMDDTDEQTWCPS